MSQRAKASALKIRLLTVGKAPPWIAAGFAQYAQRLPANALQLAIVRARRGDTEEQCLLRAVRERELLVLWDRRGERTSSEGFAALLDRWRMGGRDVALLIGGTEGFGVDARARAAHVLSLSQMTFPHQLARVMVAEQVYRAWTMLAGHPYHR